jgi:Flp pilus assembly protein TadD
MSPEQVECFRNGAQTVELDGRADIFALGVVLHELLCGELPYQRVARSTTIDELAELAREGNIHEQMSFKWSAPAQYRRLQRIVQRCMALDPADRYQSADELLADLRHELSLLQRTRRWIRKRRRTVLAAAAATFVLATAMATGLATRDPFPVRELNKGLRALRENDFQGAEIHLTRSIEQQPTREAYVARGEAYIGMEDYHSAIRDLSAADKIERDGRTCALIGYCCNMMQSHSSATGWYKRAIALGYFSPAVYNNLGFSHYNRGRYDAAIDALDSAVASGEWQIRTLRNRAAVHLAKDMKSGQVPLKAMTDVESLIGFGYCTPETYHLAAMIYGYAYSIDNSFEDQAKVNVALAVKSGVPRSQLTSLLAANVQTDVNIEIGESSTGDYSRTDHFINPVQ